jgi:hypothetical protein
MVFCAGRAQCPENFAGSCIGPRNGEFKSS